MFVDATFLGFFWLSVCKYFRLKYLKHLSILVWCNQVFDSGFGWESWLGSIVCESRTSALSSVPIASRLTNSTMFFCQYVASTERGYLPHFYCEVLLQLESYGEMNLLCAWLFSVHRSWVLFPLSICPSYACTLTCFFGFFRDIARWPSGCEFPLCIPMAAHSFLWIWFLFECSLTNFFCTNRAWASYHFPNLWPQGITQGWLELFWQMSWEI